VRYLLFAIVFLGCIAAASTASEGTDINEIVRKGIELCQQRRFNDALDQYRRAIALDSGCTAAFNNAGIVYLKCFEYELAERLFRKVIQLEPRDGIGYDNLGHALYGLGRYDEALTAWRTALDVCSTRPQEVMIYLNIGRALLMDGRSSWEAAAAFHQALNMDPDYAEGYVWLAQVYDGDLFFLKFNLYQKAVEIDSNCCAAYREWGKALYYKALSRTSDAWRENIRDLPPDRTAMVEAAIEMVQKALSIDSTSATMFRELGDMLTGIGQVDEAGKAYEKANILSSKSDMSNLGRKGR
jgi:tetratricopeptide (TPR) repeat protein